MSFEFDTHVHSFFEVLMFEMTATTRFGKKVTFDENQIGEMVHAALVGMDPKEIGSRYGLDRDEAIDLLNRCIEEFRKDTHLGRSAYQDMLFHELVSKALWESGLRTSEEMHAFLVWALGKDHRFLRYQDWPAKIMTRTRIININKHTPIKPLLRAAVELWKRNSFMMLVN